MTERDLLAAILARYGAIKGLRMWRQNTAAGMLIDPGRLAAALAARFGLPRAAIEQVIRDAGRYMRFGVPGQGDLSGVLAPSGQRLEIECKYSTRKQSKEQVSFQAMIEAHGGLYLLVREPVIPELEHLL